MAKDHDNAFVGFVRAQSASTQAALQALPYSDALHAHFTALSQQSVAAQKEIEALDSMPFEVYRQQYVAADRLGVPARCAVPA